MKPFTLVAAFAALLSSGASALSTEAGTSKVTLPVEFKPPQVFKNANLVHVISLEKNYAKEQINILVENVSDKPQSEYFLPFTSDQVSRIGGLEVRDRKDPEAGAFVTELVEFDPLSDIQYYRIQLPTPLKPKGQQTIGIVFYALKAFRALPASIAQDAEQYLVHDFSIYTLSAYPTQKQKTEVKASAIIPQYTTIGDFPQKQGSKLTYGPFDEKPAGAVHAAQVRFEFTKPVTHVANLERDIEVSHWGGNVAFEERYTIFHRGANLTHLFNRVKWAQSQFQNPTSYALKELRVPLQVGSEDAYFTDTIGNVSTSRFRSNKREAMLELKPRYPIFGGWKYPFTIGWNSNAANFVRKTSAGGFIFKAPLLEGPKQVEGVEYGRLDVRVLLPEGAENVKVYTDLPTPSLLQTAVGVHQTYLDTVGRTSVTIKAQNLVDELRDRQLYIAYDLSQQAVLRKPLVIFTSMVTVFVATWAVSKVPMGFSK